MSALMLWHGHRWPAIAEMGLAMLLSFAVLLPPYRAGLLSADAVLVTGHVLMLPAMAVALLRRREEYLRTH